MLSVHHMTTSANRMQDSLISEGQSVTALSQTLSAEPLQANQVVPLLKMVFGSERLEEKQLNNMIDAFRDAQSAELDGQIDEDSKAVLNTAADKLLDKRNLGESVSFAQLLDLIMQISLRDGERRRETDEQLRPLIHATAITLMVLSKEALDTAFIGHVLSSIGTMLDGAKDLIGTISKVPKEGMDRLGTIFGKQSAVQGTLASQLESISEVAKHYLGETSQHLDGKLSLDDAAKQALSQEIQQMIHNGSRLALIVASGWFISIEGSKK